MTAVVLGGLGGLRACVQTPPCEVVELDSGAVGVFAPSAWEGRYHLVLVATRGAGTGRSEDGTLHLVLQDEALRTVPGLDGEPISGVEQPLRGTLTGEPSQLGATVPGDLLSRDPQAPGVVVIRSVDPGGGGESLMLRLGSEANRRGRSAFDEAYTVLRIRAAQEDGFAGDWESGGGEGEAGGHFCAVRVPA